MVYGICGGVYAGPSTCNTVVTGKTVYHPTTGDPILYGPTVLLCT